MGWSNENLGSGFAAPSGSKAAPEGQRPDACLVVASAHPGRIGGKAAVRHARLPRRPRAGLASPRAPTGGGAAGAAEPMRVHETFRRHNRGDVRRLPVSRPAVEISPEHGTGQTRMFAGRRGQTGTRVAGQQPGRAAARRASRSKFAAPQMLGGKGPAQHPNRRPDPPRDSLDHQFRRNGHRLEYPSQRPQDPQRTHPLRGRRTLPYRGSR